MLTLHEVEEDAASTSSSYAPTNTLLAVVDGPIPPSSKDLVSHTVSWVGGYPAFPSLPSSSSSVPKEINCGSCHRPIPLLSQVYCPPDGGENDRTVYVFGCWRTACQRRQGSIRAFRASVRNEVYVRDVIEQRERRRQEEQERLARDAELAKINPFSAGNVDNPALTAGQSSLGASLFGAAPSPSPSAATANPFNPFAQSTTEATAPSTPVPDVSKLSITDAKSNSAPAGPSTPAVVYQPPLPAYQPAQYLSTFEEYLPRLDHPHHVDRKGLSKEQAKYVKEVDADEFEGGKGGGGSGGSGAEHWERVLPKGVDEVFEHFVKRLQDAEDGEDQVLRYDFGSQPLPYSSHSDLYKKLFPASTSARPGEYSSITKGAFNVSQTKSKSRSAKPSSGDGDDEDPDSEDEEDSELATRYRPEGVVPPCPRCGSERVFEMQLVPGLLAQLKVEQLTTKEPEKKSKRKSKNKDESSQSQQSAEERRKELAALLSGTSTGVSATDDADVDQDEKLLEISKNQIGMEWGNVMVFGCSKDCAGFSEEWVGVEWEEAE